MTPFSLDWGNDGISVGMRAIANNNYVFYIEVDDIDAAYAELSKAQAAERAMIAKEELRTLTSAKRTDAATGPRTAHDAKNRAKYGVPTSPGATGEASSPLASPAFMLKFW